MMRNMLIGLVFGCAFVLTGAAKPASAQVTWHYPENYPSVCWDAQGFLNWLNYERTNHRNIYGQLEPLPAVGYDASLEWDCHQNNLQQFRNGLGHFYMGRGRRQNAAAVSDFSKVGPIWMNSPGHRAALLDPTIRYIAVTYYAGYTTFSAY